MVNLSIINPSRKRQLLGAVAAIAILASAGQGMISAAQAQGFNNNVAAPQPGQPKSRLLVDAREIVYDNDRELVQAKGDVQLYYQGRTLEADRVTYDRKTKRVYAEGNAKLTETTGQILYSDRFELTDDFRDGFIDSLRIVAPDKQKITAARGERIDGETNVFERGTYTACDTCKDNPEKPPLWQVKARRIIHKNSEQLIYFEDARLEFFGLPIGYIPYFSAPDPTVRRKSGLLAPRYFSNSALGYGFGLPIYFAPAPHYDLLWTPTVLSKQGMLNQLEWRHRLETGVYNIRAAGIFQADPGAFLSSPLGPNKTQFVSNPAAPFTLNGVNNTIGGTTNLIAGKVDKRAFRGSIETTGKFLINKNWTFGWDVALTSDKYFLSQYRVRSEAGQINFFKETVSSLYLRGKTDKAYFDLTGYSIQGQTFADWNKQIPTVHPSLDFNRRFNPAGIGGELTIDVNAASISREQADYVGLPAGINGQRSGSTKASPSTWFGGPSIANFGGTLSPYFGCIEYKRENCLLRGIAGNSNRASATISWRRNFIDPLGQVWTPFVNAQVDAVNYSLNGTPSAAPSINTYSNSHQSNFLQSSDSFARAMPTIGLEYRYPMVATSSFATHLFEPIAQIMASPNEQKVGKMPNEDSQSLVFSDSNIFSINRFSGYDRTEGGIRANVGAQYTATFNNGGYVNILAGQSYHLGGRNSFAAYGTQTDLLNVGLNSGLDKTRSDYVGRFALSPSKGMTFIARGRFDEASMKLKRFEAIGSFTAGQVSTNFTYTRQDPQPDLGFVRRREAVSVSNTLRLPENWYVTSSLVVDLDQYLVDRDVAALTGSTSYKKTLFRPTAMSLGVGYADECTTFSFTYIRSRSADLSAKNTTGNAFWLRLELKHLGQVNYRTGITSTSDSVAR
jgi:LPS-assembly protein